MKDFLEDQPSSNEASTSDQSNCCDQEMGSKNPKDHIEGSLFSPFLLRIDAKIVRMVLAEAVGTFILMFCISGITAITQMMKGEVGLLEYAATATLAVIVVVYSIGSISGAHVNPAVTLAFASAGPFPWFLVPFYLLAQVLGSIMATYVGKMVYGIEAELMTTRPLNGCTAAFWTEFIATFIILFLTASLYSHHKSVEKFSGFVVGSVIGLGVLITGPVSGGSMNPARSLGPAIVSWSFDSIWIYLVAPTAGAVSGALLLRALRLQGWSCSASPHGHLPSQSFQ